MAKFTTTEKKLLRYITDDRLQNSLGMIRQAMEDIWAVDMPRIIQDYTDHGNEHSARLVTHVIDLLKANNGQRLTTQEMYLLLAGIYLHDIGMQCHVVKWPEIKRLAEERGARFDIPLTAPTANQYSIKEQKAIRKNHQYLAAAWINYAHRTEETVLGRAAQTIPDDLVGDLMDVCQFHAKLPIAECREAFELDPTQRKRLVAALLRFADELDVDEHRVSSIETVKSFGLDPGNSVYWWLHNYTKVNFKTKHSIQLLIRLHPDDEKIHGAFIHDAFINRFRDKNQQVLSVLADNDIPLVIAAGSGVVGYEHAEPLPQEIIQALQEMQQESSSTRPSSVSTSHQDVSIPSVALESPKSSKFDAKILPEPLSDPDQLSSELRHLQEIYEEKMAYLRKLELRQASQGSSFPIAQELEMEKIRKEIKELQKEIVSLEAKLRLVMIHLNPLDYGQS